ncbi:hypothetical protein JT359_19330 [Candidatus Poribacteria bacterium]|nr:hypothetical protein [Candidatus Poribacteria bacterium]
MATQEFLYLVAIPSQLTELASAESIALTGNPPNEYGITISDTCVNVCRGAYLKSCIQILFSASSVEELCTYIKAADLYEDEFRVSVIKKPKSLNINSMTLASQIGSLIDGKPNLSRPRVVFPTVITSEKIWFGRLLSESDGEWKAHDHRPHTTSSSLPARLAHVLVNLVAGPGEHILDPCCGTGTIVMAAAHNGLQASGSDNNPRMIGATTKNLHHFGLTANIKLEDAKTVDGRFDAVATDLPYGISLVKDTVATTEILANLRSLAPKAAFIDIRDLTKPLNDLGYTVETVIPVPKQRIVRKVFITSTNNQ